MVTEGPGVLLTLLAFGIVIGSLVFVHEYGHYWAGRLFGVKADAFSIGFGKELAGWTDSRGTRWKIGALPLGGYVQFAGDMGAASQPNPAFDSLPQAERDQMFQAKPLWQRAIIVAAGPITNFVIAILIFAGFFLAFGQPVTPSVVPAVQEGSAAQSYGLQPGDRILSVAGTRTDTFGAMAREVSIHPDEAVVIEVERAGQTLALNGTIGNRLERDRFGNDYKFGMLGVPWPKQIIRDVPVWEAPIAATKQVGEVVRLMVTTLGQVISGRRSVKELGGPLKIAQVSGEQLSLGVYAFIGFIALISINLGFINLLPIPMLDGGHLLMYALEAVRRKPVEPQAVEWAYRTGFAVVIAFMLLVTFNDLSSFGLF